MSGEHFVFSIEDERDRSITLSEERLEHITTAHPELEDQALIALLIEAVEAPYEIHYGATDEEWFYVNGGPSRWVKVVIVFDSMSSGRIITAFPRRRKP